MLSFLNEANLCSKNGMSACVKMGDWIKLMCLSLINFIPVVGFIVYLVMYLCLTFSSDTATSVRNYLKASLLIGAVFSALMIVLFIALSAYLGASIAALSNLG